MVDLRRRERWDASFLSTLGRFTALALVFLFFAILVEGGKFYSPRNLENILRHSAVYATASLGMTRVIIAAGIALSIDRKSTPLNSSHRT